MIKRPATRQFTSVYFSVHLKAMDSTEGKHLTAPGGCKRCGPVGMVSRWRFMPDHLPGLVALVDNDLQYSYVNQTFENKFGLPAAYIPGKTVPSIIGKAA